MGSTLRRSAIPVLAAMACSAHTCASREPRVGPRFSAHSVTVLVTNASDVPLIIGAYANFEPAIPQNLGGALRLGSVKAHSSACIKIPDTDVVAAGGPVVWTSARPLALTVLDTTGLHQLGQSAGFIPERSAGWSVTMPSYGASLVARLRCTP